MRLVIWPCLLLLLLFNAVFAAPQDQSGLNAVRLNEYLTREKAILASANQDALVLIKSFAPVDQASLSLQKVQNSKQLALIRVKIAGFTDFLSSQRKLQQNLNRQLKELQQMPLDKVQDVHANEERINYINALKSENSKTIELIGDNLDLAQTYQATLLAEHDRLELLQANMTEKDKLHDIRDNIRKLEEKRDSLYEKNLELQQKQQARAGFDEKNNDERQIILNNQLIILLQQQIIELGMQEKLIVSDFQLLKDQDVKTIESAIDAYTLAVKQASGMEQSLKNMQNVLTREQAVFSDRPYKQQMKALQKEAEARLKHAISQQELLRQELKKKQEILNKKLASRQSLSEYHIATWPAITSQILEIPGQLYRYARVLVMKVYENYLKKDLWSAILVWGSLFSILFAGMAFRRVLNAALQGKERSSMSGYLYDGALVLLSRNVFQLMTALIFLVIFYLNNMVYSNYQLLVDLFLVWLVYRNLILLARMVFLERLHDSSGKDVKLYYRLKWLLLGGGVSTALMVLGQQMPLSLLLQDIFNRLFMLFLLALSLVAWKSRDVISLLLLPLLKAKKRYLRTAVSLLMLLVPLTLFTTAMIGLVGYIDLAWTLSRYQAYILLVITSYVLVRGLVMDGLVALSRWMIASMQNGWLWIEVVVKPMDAVVRVALVIASIAILFELFDWTPGSPVVMAMMQVGHYPFVNLSGARISLFSVTAFIVLVFVFIWFAKWTREFCYRWLYRHIIDPGIRNSLSVFTQYAVVAFGGLLALRVLGVDFSGMAIVFGGLAVGMGFGLRDFASNIVGGIMLLIERPVREGDLITIGEYEGRVSHIGIRSMRVSSWDNMEVLIPNAETFSKPFTNWTHQDNIVRTVVPIKVSRADDPERVRELIQDVLANIPEVLDNPPAQVLLKQITDSLLDFEIRYFINVQQNTRIQVSSKFLFEVMEVFKAEGIHAPIPLLNVELKQDDSKASASED